MRVVLRLALGLQVRLDLGVHGVLRQRELDVGAQPLEELVAGRDGAVGLLVLRHLLAQVGAQLVDGVELRGQLGELVVGRRQLALLDAVHRDGHLGLLAGVLAADEGGGEGGGLTGAQAADRLVEALEHGAGAHLVGGAGDRVDLLAVHGGLEVDGDEVVVGGGAVHADERAEALAEGLEPLLDVLVGHLDGVDGDLVGAQVGELDLRTDVDLRGEDELAAEGAGDVRDLGDIDLGLAERLDAGLGDGVAVQAGQRVVDGVLDDRGAPDPLVDDARRDLALTEPGDVDLLADVGVGVVDGRLELLVGHLDGELRPGGLKILDGALHCNALHSSVP